MTTQLTSATRLIALLGNPVAHSMSPVFQNAAFRAAGVDGVYLSLRCDPEGVTGLLRGIALSGGGGNVTVPHKEVAARSVDRGTEAVRRTGACNTYWAEGSVVCGDNTDVVGTSGAVRTLLGGPPAGARVLLVGGGGAASAALAALAAEGVREVAILNRTAERARTLADRFSDAGLRLHLATHEESLPDGVFDLAINATPLGLYEGDALPTSARLLPRLRAAFDMTYRGGGTDWTRGLADAGLPVVDGREMLLWQGIAAFERWWGREAPVKAMREAIFGGDEEEGIGGG